MKIRFERTGGVAGRRVKTTIDSAALDAADERALRELLEAASVFDLPTSMTAPQAGADRFHYRLTVEIEERRHTVEISDAAAPSALRPLLDWLTDAASRPGRE